MEVPVRNLVETVDLTEDDILLPMLECIVNSIISLEKSQLPKSSVDSGSTHINLF